MTVDHDAMIPPHSIEAEMSVLGSIVLSTDAFDDVERIIDATDFHDSRLALMYRTAAEMRKSQTPIDPVTLAERLGDRLEQAGGLSYIMQALETVPYAAHAEYYAKIVRENSDRRRAIRVGCDLAAAARLKSEDITDVVGKCRDKLDAIENHAIGEDEPVSILDAMTDFLSTLDDPKRGGATPTGFADLDAILCGGMRGGQLLILAARPGVGKSALAANIACNVAQTSPALFFTLEMSQVELTERILSARSGIDHGALKSGKLSPADKSKSIDYANRIGGLKLSIDDKTGRTASKIAAIARRYRRRCGLSLVVVDYLQLMGAEDPKASREQQVASMSRALKLLAKDLDVPVMCLAQLNRAIESRENRRPRLSDLRESGAIEQDADAEMFLDRPAMYDQNASPAEALLHVEKHRGGKTGTVNLHWKAASVCFAPRSFDDEPDMGQYADTF